MHRQGVTYRSDIDFMDEIARHRVTIHNEYVRFVEVFEYKMLG
jgi:hypothetical protein